jgi:hypothetical protein
MRQSMLIELHFTWTTGSSPVVTQLLKQTIVRLSLRALTEQSGAKFWIASSLALA